MKLLVSLALLMLSVGASAQASGHQPTRPTQPCNVGIENADADFLELKYFTPRLGQQLITFKSSNIQVELTTSRDGKLTAQAVDGGIRPDEPSVGSLRDILLFTQFGDGETLATAQNVRFVLLACGKSATAHYDLD